MGNDTRFRGSIGTGAVVALAPFLALAGCAATDVVGKGAAESFGPISYASAERISYADGVWKLSSTAGDEFRLSVDTTRPEKGDVEFSFDFAPFSAAGVDAAKRPVSDETSYEVVDGRLIVRFELGSEPFAVDSSESMQKAVAELARNRRDRIGYHAALDHYGITLGSGHMLEWAKDMTKNDKDIVWVLNPEPFIVAGLDPTQLRSWIFAPVEMMEKGKKIQVDRLLKPFDL